MTQYILAFIFPTLSFLLQVYPRFFNKYFGVDVWTRLLEIGHVKRAHHKIPNVIKRGFIIEGKFDYPIIFPWMFSFFSKKFLLKIQSLVSPFFDALQNLLVFYIAFVITQNLWIALLAQFMYSVIPIIPIENSYLTPRSLGYLNFTLAFFPIFMFHTTHNPILLLLSFFFTCTLFLTHRFAIQSLIFISIFFSVVDHSIYYLLNLAAAFITVVILTKGFYLRVAKGHLYNIYFWIPNYKFRFTHQIHGLKPKNTKDWVGKIYSFMSQLSPLFVLSMNVWAFSAFVYFYLNFNNFLNIDLNIIYFRMSLWIIFFYILGSIILAVKRLTPIGEGMRYMEMASVPSVILAASLFVHLLKAGGSLMLIPLFVLLLGNLSVILFFQIKGIITDKTRSLTPDLINTYKYINKLRGRPRIICIPHQITTMTVYNTHADVLVNADNPGLMKIQEVYPLLKKSIKELARKYDLDYLLLRKNYATPTELKVKNNKVVFQSGDVLLIKLSPGD